MIAVITGDIVGSRKVEAHIWLSKLKEILFKYGTAPSDWEIYRGDSFQLKLKAEQAFEAVLFLKSKFKQFTNLDVRIAIGIGSMNHDAQHITESNGEAFINSGECFENMKGILGIQTPWNDCNETLSLIFNLASSLMSQWTPVSSKIITAKILHPEKNQSELAELLNTKQPLVSDALSRANFKVIKKVNDYYINQINKRC